MVAQTVERFGGVDILVNNAGITHFVDFHDLEGMTEEKWDHILAVNVKGLFFCSRAVVPEMQRRGAGCIVNVASTAGVRGMGSSIAYCASKAAVINLTMTFAQAFAPEIRVNCVAPGYIETRWHLARGGDPEPYRNAVANMTPLKRVCQPEDVAQAILGIRRVRGHGHGADARGRRRHDDARLACRGFDPSGFDAIIARLAVLQASPPSRI